MERERGGGRNGVVKIGEEREKGWSNEKATGGGWAEIATLAMTVKALPPLFGKSDSHLFLDLFGKFGTSFEKLLVTCTCYARARISVIINC